MAPSNAAARLIGGDTMHASCRLPFSNARLTTKKGRLDGASLQKHRRAWAETVACFMDEVSMVAADKFLQCDVRIRQAAMEFDKRFGGFGMTICGDFLQLPPVSKDGQRSLAAPPEPLLEEHPEEADEHTGKDEAARRHSERLKRVEQEQGTSL